MSAFKAKRFGGINAFESSSASSSEGNVIELNDHRGILLVNPPAKLLHHTEPFADSFN